eukprot:gene42099-57000_t
MMLSSLDTPTLTKAELADLLFERLGLPGQQLSVLIDGLRAAQAGAGTDSGSAPLLPPSVTQLGWLGLTPATVAALAPHVTLPTPVGVTRIDVETAVQMHDAVFGALPADAAVMVAAVADWRVAAAGQKIKKGDGAPVLTLVENPDILATLAGDARRPALLIGFAAETEKVIEHAIAKRARKKVDWIVANDVSPATGVMGGDRNTVHLLTRAGAEIDVESWPVMSKDQVAVALVAPHGMHGMRLFGHTLVWYANEPDGFVKLDESRQSFEGALRNYVTAMVGRYRGLAAGWDVVNEPVMENGEGWRESLWTRKLGQIGHFKVAFEAAKAADPDTV